MPFLVYEGPHLASESARAHLVARLTEVVARYYQAPPEEIIILLKEQGGAHMAHTPGALAQGGTLLETTG